MKHRKIIAVLSCLTILISATGCAKETVPSESSSTEVLLKVPDETITSAISDPEDDFIDLTSMSATMVYAEVYDMMYSPENYIGKTVKMEGSYVSYHDDLSGKDYFACIIKDATACCAQGMEFVLTDDYIYPDDYPEDGNTITVTGVFSTYTEGEDRYCTLLDATLG